MFPVVLPLLAQSPYLRAFLASLFPFKYLIPLLLVNSYIPPTPTPTPTFIFSLQSKKEMGFVQLVNTREATLAFKARYNIPLDIGIEYFPQEAIEDCRKQDFIIISLFAVIEGGVRFHLCPLLL